MKKKVTLTSIIVLLFINAFSQEVIRLYKDKAPGSENWIWNEKEMSLGGGKTRLVYNVSTPTLTVFNPEKAVTNGTAVIVCPGGAFHILSIDNEGIDVAKWLNTKGITAFVLKYRLVKSETDNPLAELMPLMSNSKKLDSINAPVVELAIQDGLIAIKYVRENSDKYGIDKHKIGIMGFSAGGTLTIGATLNSTAETRPDFLAPVYPYCGAVNISNIPKNEPPAFIAAASDDNLGLASHSVTLYSNWIASGNIAELHMYSKGGHGFGMSKRGLPIDTWYERFGDWLTLMGFM